MGDLLAGDFDELKTRAYAEKAERAGLEILYARAKTRLWEKIERLRGVPGLRSRLRNAAAAQLSLAGVRVNAMGTIGESSPGPRILTSRISTILRRSEQMRTSCRWQWRRWRRMRELKESQYSVLELWQQTYQGELLIMLPDTFGTTQFLAGAPDWVADWTGQRIDSKDPYVAGDEYIAWLKKRGRDPRKKRLIASDALDVDSILAFTRTLVAALQRAAGRRSFERGGFSKTAEVGAERRIRFSSGWGTFLTNDFRGCDPRADDGFDPISLVCKLSRLMDGRR